MSVVALLNNEEVEVPEELLKESTFYSVLNSETWESLTFEEKRHLRAYLPESPCDNEFFKEETVKLLFDSGEVFHFNHPVSCFYEKFTAGFFAPKVAMQLKENQEKTAVKRRIMEKKYFRNLLKQLITSRQELLSNLYQHGPEYILLNRRQFIKPKNSVIGSNVKRKYLRVIKDVKAQFGENELSSDDISDDERFSASSGKYYSGIGKAELYSSSREPIATHSISELGAEKFKSMIDKHQKRRLLNKVHPQLDTTNISLADVIIRCNPPKKGRRGRKMRKLRKREETTKEPRASAVLGDGGEPVSGRSVKELAHRTSCDSEDTSSNRVRVKQEADPAPHSSFFSLVASLFQICKGCTATQSWIEERVAAWQEDADSKLCAWRTLYPDWEPLVNYCLEYLSGGGMASLLPGFVPMLRYKADEDSYKWTGPEFLHDSLIVPLNNHWLETLNKVVKRVEPLAEGTKKTTIDTNWTEFSVRETTPEEKEHFRIQERERYKSPHLPFIYDTHQYQSIVGPVKGVFTVKEAGQNKAREHVMLISERPAYVTILSLVRDAVARLPNGEGTRADVCLLLKDSQFLNTEASDSQIHTVVSGALDRLHAEKDPCVKFDSQRKLWIYLHRSRSMEEFRKVHEESAAAAAAKKQSKVTKPKSGEQKRSSDSDVALEKPKKSRKKPSDSAADGIDASPGASNMDDYQQLPSALQASDAASSESDKKRGIKRKFSASDAFESAKRAEGMLSEEQLAAEALKIYEQEMATRSILGVDFNDDFSLVDDALGGVAIDSLTEIPADVGAIHTAGEESDPSMFDDPGKQRIVRQLGEIGAFSAFGGAQENLISSAASASVGMHGKRYDLCPQSFTAAFPDMQSVKSHTYTVLQKPVTSMRHKQSPALSGHLSSEDLSSSLGKPSASDGDISSYKHVDELSLQTGLLANGRQPESSKGDSVKSKVKARPAVKKAKVRQSTNSVASAVATKVPISVPGVVGSSSFAGKTLVLHLDGGPGLQESPSGLQTSSTLYHPSERTVRLITLNSPTVVSGQQKAAESSPVVKTLQGVVGQIVSSYASRPQQPPVTSQQARPQQQKALQQVKLRLNAPMSFVRPSLPISSQSAAVQAFAPTFGKHLNTLSLESLQPGSVLLSQQAPGVQSLSQMQAVVVQPNRTADHTVPIDAKVLSSASLEPVSQEGHQISLAALSQLLTAAQSQSQDLTGNHKPPVTVSGGKPVLPSSLLPRQPGSMLPTSLPGQVPISSPVSITLRGSSAAQLAQFLRRQAPATPLNRGIVAINEPLSKSAPSGSPTTATQLSPRLGSVVYRSKVTPGSALSRSHLSNVTLQVASDKSEKVGSVSIAATSAVKAISAPIQTFTLNQLMAVAKTLTQPGVGGGAVLAQSTADSAQIPSISSCGVTVLARSTAVPSVFSSSQPTTTIQALLQVVQQQQQQTSGESSSKPRFTLTASASHHAPGILHGSVTAPASRKPASPIGTNPILVHQKLAGVPRTAVPTTQVAQGAVVAGLRFDASAGVVDGTSTPTGPGALPLRGHTPANVVAPLKISLPRPGGMNIAGTVVQLHPAQPGRVQTSLIRSASAQVLSTFPAGTKILLSTPRPLPETQPPEEDKPGL